MWTVVFIMVSWCRPRCEGWPVRPQNFFCRQNWLPSSVCKIGCRTGPVRQRCAGRGRLDESKHGSKHGSKDDSKGGVLRRVACLGYLGSVDLKRLPGARFQICRRHPLGEIPTTKPRKLGKTVKQTVLEGTATVLEGTACFTR